MASDVIEPGSRWALSHDVRTCHGRTLAARVVVVREIVDGAVIGSRADGRRVLVSVPTWLRAWERVR